MAFASYCREEAAGMLKKDRFAKGGKTASLKEKDMVWVVSGKLTIRNTNVTLSLPAPSEDEMSQRFGLYRTVFYGLEAFCVPRFSTALEVTAEKGPLR